jgi:hypothetical protein
LNNVTACSQAVDLKVDRHFGEGQLYSPDYNRTVWQENKSVGLDLDDRFDHEAALNIFFRSDQFPFVLQNVPAFWWFTGFHPDYHHTTDTADKINYVKMSKILRLVWRASECSMSCHHLQPHATALKVAHPLLVLMSSAPPCFLSGRNVGSS